LYPRPCWNLKLGCRTSRFRHARRTRSARNWSATRQPADIWLKLYIRPTWREVQQQRGRLNFPEYWKLTLDLARQHNKRVGFRIQMRAPDYREEAMPDFVLEKVPMVKLEGGTWRRNGQTTFSEPTQSTTISV
jgi:hypothetical protein